MANKYIVKKRARFTTIVGREVNLPFGTPCYVYTSKNSQNEEISCIYYKGSPLCLTQSQIAHDYFSANDDNYGEKRGHLIAKICNKLKVRDNNYQNRWDKIWEDKTICPKYKRVEHEDFWIWNNDFYEAPIFDLEYIWGLIKNN